MFTENRAIVEQFVEEVWNQGNMEVLRRSVTPDCILHEPLHDSPVTGMAAREAYVTGMRAVVADLHLSIDEMIADGSRVVARWTLTGTPVGRILDVTPTGRPIRVRGVDVYHLADGKIAETWSFTHALPLLHQLGATALPQSNSVTA